MELRGIRPQSGLIFDGFFLTDGVSLRVVKRSGEPKGAGRKRKHGMSANDRRLQLFPRLEDFTQEDFANAAADKVYVDPNKHDLCFMMHHESTPEDPRLFRYTSMGRRSRLQSVYFKNAQRKIIETDPAYPQIQNAKRTDRLILDPSVVYFQCRQRRISSY